MNHATDMTTTTVWPRLVNRRTGAGWPVECTVAHDGDHIIAVRPPIDADIWREAVRRAAPDLDPYGTLAERWVWLAARWEFRRARADRAIRERAARFASVTKAFIDSLEATGLAERTVIVAHGESR